MLIKFEKYHGAGNDFIIIDNRIYNLSLTTEQISFLCHRRFGIGADGMMTINLHPIFDYEMKYYNSDGKESTMCGNGGRCIAAYAYSKKIADKKQNFLAKDGLHHAEIIDSEVRLSMINVDKINFLGDGYFLNTGSPHFVIITKDIDKIDVFNEGRKFADDKRFAPERTNVNFISITPQKNTIKIATYERGVEAETLACGTGAVAAAITAYEAGIAESEEITLIAKGGTLKVKFRRNEGIYSDIILQGPAIKVFHGEIEV
jgi:diaminopimelate epimerase